jgi:hypothetical protein
MLLSAALNLYTAWELQVKTGTAWTWRQQPYADNREEFAEPPPLAIEHGLVTPLHVRTEPCSPESLIKGICLGLAFIG